MGVAQLGRMSECVHSPNGKPRAQSVFSQFLSNSPITKKVNQLFPQWFRVAEQRPITYSDCTRLTATNIFLELLLDVKGNVFPSPSWSHLSEPEALQPTNRAMMHRALWAIRQLAGRKQSSMYCTSVRAWVVAARRHARSGAPAAGSATGSSGRPPGRPGRACCPAELHTAYNPRCPVGREHFGAVSPALRHAARHL